MIDRPQYDELNQMKWKSIVVVKVDFILLIRRDASHCRLWGWEREGVREGGGEVGGAVVDDPA